MIRQGSGVLRSVCLCVCVCVCLSVREHISGTAGPTYAKFLCRLPVACGRGSVLLWLRCDTLCTSGFCMTTTYLAVVGRMAMRG